jgi:Domain of unknown function (DUF4124)
MRQTREFSVGARQICLAMLMLFAAGSAGAQMYKWVDENGKVRYGDTPPPGVKISPVKAPQSGRASTAAVPGAKDAKKGPLTAAEQDMAFRKRQAEAGKAAEKAEADLRAEAKRSEACERTREYVRTLESGQRIARTSPSGEKYYLDDGQVAQELAKEQAIAQANCK